ncbi:quinolinate synthase NadA [Thermodesulfobacteriota bacterium]
MDEMTDNSDDKKIIERIKEIKEDLGERLVILTHHYQRKEIVDLGDFRGDSFGLSQRAASDNAARYIVFCGVHFMAESAEILSQPHQTVQIPDEEAGCWMADMADIHVVGRAWEELASVAGSGTIIPIVYMNSDAELKAFCGRNGGIVCTSSNAPAAFEWGFGKGDKILFFPDQHLGRNTGNRMNIPPDEMILWNPDKPLGGNTPGKVKRARVILWDGYCLVHTRFKVEHIREMKKRFPEAKVVVHPECTEEVVASADAVGSTSFIVKYVENSPPGSTILVGTEINLIDRLNIETPDREVLPLHPSLCPNMSRINLKNLLWTLENIGRVNVVKVPEEIKTDARKALDRMLTLST